MSSLFFVGSIMTTGFVVCPVLRGVVFKADQAGLELAIESVASEEWFVTLTVGLT